MLDVKGNRFEYEMNVLLKASKEIQIETIPIAVRGFSDWDFATSSLAETVISLSNTSVGPNAKLFTTPSSISSSADISASFIIPNEPSSKITKNPHCVSFRKIPVDKRLYYFQSYFFTTIIWIDW